MNIAGREFKPAYWSILLTIFGVVIFSALGLWQLERAAYKESIRLNYSERLAAGYQRYEADEMIEDIGYRRLIFEGRFDNRHHFMLDNQVYDGQAGYHVLTPFLIKDSDAIILVNRGWAPWGASRENLPRIHPLAVDGRVSGITHVPQPSKFRLGEIELQQNWPQLIPYLDIEDLREQYSARLLPMILWLAPEQADHYVREWQPVWMPPEKSRAYAVQWFSFAAIAVLLFFILNLRKTE